MGPAGSQLLRSRVFCLREHWDSVQRGEVTQGWGDWEGFSCSRWQNAVLYSKNLLTFFNASAIASGGGGLGGLVFGKENFLSVGPQGALIAVTPSLPHTRSWRGFCLVCMSWPSHHICWSFYFRHFAWPSYTVSWNGKTKKVVLLAEIWGRCMLLGHAPFRIWLITGISVGPRLCRHTQIAVVAGRDTCHAELRNPESGRLVRPPHTGLLGSIPYEYWPGLSLFTACQLCFPPHLVPARNKYVSLVQAFRAVQHETSCPHCCQ